MLAIARIVPSIIGLILATPATAQQQRVKPCKRVPGLDREVALDLRTGAYTRGPRVHDRGGTTVADFRNLDALDGAGFGWLGVDTGNGACRWFDAASKGTGVNQSSNASDLVSDVVFAYCSNALDVSSGGPGGAVTLGFYEGYTLFGGSPTTAVAVVSLTGMPANTADGSFFSGGAGCYVLRVAFPTLLAFSDDSFVGYSWQYDDVGTDGVLGNTHPFLSCVVSCSGTSLVNGNAGGAGTATGLGEDGQGMLDALDQFCVAPSRRSTFTFGTTGMPFAPATRTSIAMQIQEVADLAATRVHYNATVTPNADLLSVARPIIGASWQASVSRPLPTAAGSVLLTGRSARHPLANGGSPAAPVTGRTLVAGVQLFALSGAHNGTSGVVTVPVPLSSGFCGLHFAVQARLGGGGLKLTSAAECTVGTF